MEFACQFVYVPPPANRKDARRSGPFVVKQSALLPPISRARPGFPPPPPPPSPPLLSPPPPPGRPTPAPRRLTEPPQRSPDETRRRREEEVRASSEKLPRAAPPPPPLYSNAAPPSEPLATATATPPPLSPQTPTSQTRKALLPPHVRAASSGGPPAAPDRPSSGAPPPPSAPDEPYYTAPPLDHGGGAGPDPPTTAPGGGAGGGPRTGPPILKPSAPPLPPRPPSMRPTPVYLEMLPSSAPQGAPAGPQEQGPPGTADPDSLPGNPNVILISLGKLISDGKGQTEQKDLLLCPQCSSVLDSCYDNMVQSCYFCQPADATDPASEPPPSRGGASQDRLFLLTPSDVPPDPSHSLLIFCIDVSGSMCITSAVPLDDRIHYRTRLQFVKDAVSLCVQRLCYQQPELRVGLITFNNQVTMHGHGAAAPRVLSDAELIDSDYLKTAAYGFPSPPPLAQTKDCLLQAVLGLSESGSTALGPAALLAITMASRKAGSKVIICTDGKANTDLGNLEVEDQDSKTILSSTIFYQNLGEEAARQGVTVSVLSIEGTDCRLDDLGRLADRTGGKVLIASPQNLHCEFEKMIEDKTIATHCSVTLLFPDSLCLRGERAAENKGTREVGNVTPHTEITIQFGAKEQDPEVPGAGGAAPRLTAGGSVSVQLQLSYRLRDGREMVRVITTEREVTNDSASVLSGLSLSIIQLNSSQASASLALRGRFLDARAEGDVQRLLMERALQHNCSAEEEQLYNNWKRTMEPIHGSIQNYTRKRSVVSDCQPLTDQGAALLYGMKQSNTDSFSRPDPPCPR